MITILLPHGESTAPDVRLAPRPVTVTGKRIGVVDNGLWQSMRVLTDELTGILQREYGTTVVGVDRIQTHYGRGADPKAFEAALSDLSKRVDLVITGLGN